ncbi:MAG: hypothetical protein AAFZ15_07720 [Bacteroidota bacterium]
MAGRLTRPKPNRLNKMAILLVVSIPPCTLPPLKSRHIKMPVEFMEVV